MLKFPIGVEGPLGNVYLSRGSSVDVLPRDVFEELEATAGVGTIIHEWVKSRVSVCRGKLHLCGMPQGLRTGSLVGC